jgi:hypothetical protein
MESLCSGVYAPKNMTENIVQYKPQSTESPFDSIRRFDADGNEYWMARDLQKMLGYKDWQKFEKVIQVAIENIECFEPCVFHHILAVELSGRRDYQLSRLGAYHAALACDARDKPAVKAAKQYFVIKTREAEVVIPQQNDRLRELELLLAIATAEKEKFQLQDKIQGRQDFRMGAYGLQTLLLLEGKSDQVVEVDRIIESTIDPRSNSSYDGQSLVLVKDQLKKKCGLKYASGAAVKAKLEKLGEGGLIATRPITVTHEYVPTENLAEVYRLLQTGDQQTIL